MHRIRPEILYNEVTFNTTFPERTIPICIHNSNNKCFDCYANEYENESYPFHKIGCECKDYRFHDTKCPVYRLSIQLKLFLDNENEIIYVNRSFPHVVQIYSELNIKSMKSISEFVYNISIDQNFYRFDKKTIELILQNGFKIEYLI